MRVKEDGWPYRRICNKPKNHDDECDCGWPNHEPTTVSLEQPISVLVSVVEEALGCMVIDTACQKFVTGSGWLEVFAARIYSAGINIITSEEYEVSETNWQWHTDVVSHGDECKPLLRA